ncbi:6-phosphofructokinase [Romboutsia sp. 1001713B170207_170306_H8]|uniref:6-phosphofructokinase n=1 Tax=Romboutsia sp. 1001713B170207_170306_H8 TaxID=2787112 RepID=UPI0008204214|nr:6-phosphofructokinase [Romboutsia sp. 1001713B170207_170306_H8]SCH50413.1 Pyrophosphate--fructose 6-phosphate 1-phosphotransferase [uncultured Clostridium sp.]
MKNILVAQSGGPTSAINATVAGIVEMAKISGNINKIYGAKNGIQGVIEESFIELNEILKDTSDVDLLYKTPAAALGSCRLKLNDIDKCENQYEQIIKVLRKYSIAYFIYIGGNDSMDTVEKLSRYCRVKNIDDINIIGAPKTIDNDLVETDHCPGFGSAAKYIATTFSELERDCSVYNTQSVTIVEVMGRNAGWLTASSALSRLNGGIGPNLIYLCENDFDINKFTNDVKEKLKDNNSVIVAISEGIKNSNGQYISDEVQSGVKDVFGHNYIAGAGRVLEEIVRNEIGCKVRSIELNLMQRCAGHIGSKTDLDESKALGMKAFQCANEGNSGVMVGIKRISSNPYKIEFVTTDIKNVANLEKKVPLSWINSNGNDVKKEMIDYLKPLIQGEVSINYKNGIPEYMNLY